jgi:hypothetical protein
VRFEVQGQARHAAAAIILRRKADRAGLGMPDLGPPSADAEDAGGGEGAILLVGDEVHVAAIGESAVDIAEWDLPRRR